MEEEKIYYSNMIQKSRNKNCPHVLRTITKNQIFGLFYCIVEIIENSYVEVTEKLSLSDVLPYDWSFYTYQGSLTTPPCFETVQWLVMRCPIKVTRKVFRHYNF